MLTVFIVSTEITDASAHALALAVADVVERAGTREELSVLVERDLRIERSM